MIVPCTQPNTYSYMERSLSNMTFCINISSPLDKSQQNRLIVFFGCPVQRGVAKPVWYIWKPVTYAIN